MILIDAYDIIVNVLGGISMFIFAMTSIIKSKKLMLSLQSVSHSILIVTETMTKTYSSVVQEVISIVRNLCVLFKKDPKWLMILLLIIGTGAGVTFAIILDGAKWYTFLPIIANLEYGICVVDYHINERYLKLSLVFSNLLWGIFFIMISVYTSGIVNLASSVSALISFILYKPKKVMDTKYNQTPYDITLGFDELEGKMVDSFTDINLTVTNKTKDINNLKVYFKDKYISYMYQKNNDIILLIENENEVNFRIDFKLGDNPYQNINFYEYKVFKNDLKREVKDFNLIFKENSRVKISHITFKNNIFSIKGMVMDTNLQFVKNVLLEFNLNEDDYNMQVNEIAF